MHFESKLTVQFVRTHVFACMQVKLFKSKHVIAVGAGRFHTAMCTETELYTVGQNLGQLGYKKVTETQVAPRVVSSSLLVLTMSIIYFRMH